MKGIHWSVTHGAQIDTLCAIYSFNRVHGYLCKHKNLRAQIIRNFHYILIMGLTANDRVTANPRIRNQHTFKVSIFIKHPARTVSVQAMIMLTIVAGRANSAIHKGSRRNAHIYHAKTQKQQKPRLFSRGFVFALPILRLGQAIVLPRQVPGGHLQAEKSLDFSVEALCSRYLFLRPVTRQLSSAYMCLTSVFGMGTGGPT